MPKGRFRERIEGHEVESGYAETDPTGRYGRFEEVLGKGAMKTVYKAIDKVLGMEVAWNQVILNDLLQSAEDLQRLYSEVHLLSTLNHNSIIKFYTSWIDVEQRTFNFITEMFTSGTLQEYRKRYKQVDARAIKIWARQIVAGLVYLHSHDPPVIHRDIKCDNIFVNGHLGQVKIGDLGLAAILRGSHTAHSVIGTPEFMAPELYDEDYNELVDVYSFGMCVLEMLTAEYPYCECTNPAQIYKKVTSGKLPKAFYKIEDLEAQRFVGQCLETASKRLSAKELLLDPFLAVNEEEFSPVTGAGHQKPFLNDEVRIEELQLTENPSRTNMNIRGKLNPEDDTVFLKVQIADGQGFVRNIYFPFDIASDTPLDVATEMVKELEITDWDPFEIATMIDDEISAIVPYWKKWDEIQSDLGHTVNYQKDDDSHRHQFSFSSCSSSQVSLSGLVASNEMNERTHYHDWLQDDLFDDASSQNTLQSGKYPSLHYYSGEELGGEKSPRRRDQQFSIANAHKSTRFCPDENPTTRHPLARYYHRQHKVLPSSKEASTSEYGWLTENCRSTRNRSLVDTRMQILNRSLVEDVHKRRLFNTVGAVESIGFQVPCDKSRTHGERHRCNKGRRG